MNDRSAPKGAPERPAYQTKSDSDTTATERQCEGCGRAFSSRPCVNEQHRAAHAAYLKSLPGNQPVVRVKRTSNRRTPAERAAIKDGKRRAWGSQRTILDGPGQTSTSRFRARDP